LPDDPGATQEVFRKLSEIINMPVNLNKISPENPMYHVHRTWNCSNSRVWHHILTIYNPVKVKCNIDELQQKSSKKRQWICPELGLK
jgi:hypothetical protein